MSSDLAIRVEGLGKAYTIRHQQSDHVTLAQVALERARHPFRRSERERFWALEDVSFEVRQGEVLGLIGRNGAGKSTLLKCLTRITEPTAGRIELWGRVGSLLEVGTGFHPELTGRENIYLNGAILGMTRKEIDRQFDAIVDFAGVDKFLDTPVKRYSSGMYVRLAFAVAAHLETEILLVDEVLAVGDADFQKKCLGKLSQLTESGRAVVLVSHAASVIRGAASSSMVLDEGRCLFVGPVEEALTAYAESSLSNLRETRIGDWQRADPHLGTRARFLDVRIESEPCSHGSSMFAYTVTITSAEILPNVVLSHSVRRLDGPKLGSAFIEPPISLSVGSELQAFVEAPVAELAPGTYLLSIGLGLGDDRGNVTFLDIVEDALAFEIPRAVGADGALDTWQDYFGPIRFVAPRARVATPQTAASSVE